MTILSSVFLMNAGMLQVESEVLRIFGTPKSRTFTHIPDFSRTFTHIPDFRNRAFYALRTAPYQFLEKIDFF